MKTLRQIIESKSDMIDTSDWERVGPQMGSNPGGVFKDHTGKQWYLKKSKSDNHARNEFLANKLYNHMGVPTPDHQMVTHSNGKLGTASPMMKITTYNPNSESDKTQIRKHFAAHAFLANWDAVGNGEDNQAHSPKGMMTVDAGGALNYRAQGGPKGDAFGDKVGEWESLRSPSNRSAHKVFGDMKPQELVDSAKAVANFKNSDIHRLVHTHGPGTISDKDALVAKLINRKKDIVGKAATIAYKHNLGEIKDIDAKDT